MAATAWRYVQEVVGLLQARSPKLVAALRKAREKGDRVRADRPYYWSKHQTHGMNIHVIAGPDHVRLPCRYAAYALPPDVSPSAWERLHPGGEPLVYWTVARGHHALFGVLAILADDLWGGLPVVTEAGRWGHLVDLAGGYGVPDLTRSSSGWTATASGRCGSWPMPI